MSWVLVTGSAKGLGAAIAQILAQAGHDIVVHYRSSCKEAERVADSCRKLGVKAEVIQGDFSRPTDVQPFIQEYLSRFPNTASVVHNVGCYAQIPAMETEEELWYSLFQTNLHAPVLITKALNGSLKKVITIGVAGLGKSRGVREAIAYTVTKEALWAWTRSLAKELQGKATVNMVSPGELENSVTLQLRKGLDRPGRCEEVANVVAYLLSEEGNYISGQNIEVDGGRF